VKFFLKKQKRIIRMFIILMNSLDAVDPIISLIDTKPSVFITMGAGDNWKLGKAIVEKLIKRSE